LKSSPKRRFLTEKSQIPTRVVPVVEKKIYFTPKQQDQIFISSLSSRDTSSDTFRQRHSTPIFTPHKQSVLQETTDYSYPVLPALPQVPATREQVTREQVLPVKSEVPREVHREFSREQSREVQREREQSREREVPREREQSRERERQIKKSNKKRAFYEEVILYYKNRNSRLLKSLKKINSRLQR